MGLGLRYKTEERILEEHSEKGTPYLTYPLLSRTGIVAHGFSTRLGGVSTGNCATMNISTHRGDDKAAIMENTKRIAGAIGVKPECMVYANQTHTTNVAVVGTDNKGCSLPETDGLVTNVPGICLVTFYADCVPLFFVDPVQRAVGLSHSGWRGTVDNMAASTLQKMKEAFGTNPADVIAAVGPSICQDCYEVSEDVIEKFRQNYDDAVWEELFYQKENGKYQLDLWRANAYNMQKAGILKSRIAVTNLCTCCNPEILFSHRISGFSRGNLSAFLAIKE